MRSSLGVIALSALMSALSLSATAQGGKVVLKTASDSLSYGIGTQIGRNVRQQLQRGPFSELNMDLLKAGFNDGVDSTLKVPADLLDGCVRAEMMKQQEAQMAKDNAAAELNLKKGQEWLAANGKKPGVVTTSTGLQYEVITPGAGAKPTTESQVEVHYRGTLTNGQEFDSSYKRGQPAQFALNGVIPGWTEVLQLMSEGAKWKVYIPSELAYGSRGMGNDIPGNSVLVFDIELLKVMTNCQPGTGK
ncbi:MAG TPA: FKBP-type peptidyl-prolyl cis-trans isomerase [Flavobacteriales bacterium]|jgi:FKBP-type peptidyl-prolyl cis-trans isomerase|nr:FKBP-type peptidyl-prolyl cis-trans isomerase [Flavobacteriales bacterium]